MIVKNSQVFPCASSDSLKTSQIVMAIWLETIYIHTYIYIYIYTISMLHQSNFGLQSDREGKSPA